MAFTLNITSVLSFPDKTWIVLSMIMCEYARKRENSRLWGRRKTA